MLLNFLDQYYKESDKFLEKIIKGKETWDSHMSPESKRQLMKWHTTSSLVRDKANHTISTNKVIPTVSWGRHGVLLIEFMQKETTVISAAYCSTLTKLRRTIQNKRHGLLTAAVLLLHDNATPHSAIRTQNLIRSFG